MHWWSVTELVKCWDDSSKTSLDFQVIFAWGQMQTILWLLPVLLMLLNNMKPFIWFRCFGSIADLSHIRTQWCLAGCLTKRPANLQRLIDAVRQGVLKEVDALILHWNHCWNTRRYFMDPLLGLTTSKIWCGYQMVDWVPEVSDRSDRPRRRGLVWWTM